MSISVSVGFMIPTNVVEVGNEITSDQLAAITSASTPTSANPFLTLAGGTLTGSLVFDATGLQNINKGTFDNSTGGYNGISLTCAVGYELNWQGGHLSNWYSGAYQPIHLDSVLQSNDATYHSEVGAWGFGVELTANPVNNAYIEYNQVVVQNSGGSTTIAPTGITFADATVQTTAATGVSSAKAFANAVAIHTWYVWDGFDYARNGNLNPDVEADISDGTNTAAGLPATANVSILDPDSYWYVSKDGVLSDIPIHTP